LRGPIEALTDEQFERIAPFLEADLDVVDDVPELLREIQLGRESARTEPLLDNDTVFAMARERGAAKR
jgi:hypothetical protein